MPFRTRIIRRAACRPGTAGDTGEEMETEEEEEEEVLVVVVVSIASCR